MSGISETWRANEMGFIKFLAFLSYTFNPDYCVILSGDVHYSFTMKAKLTSYSLLGTTQNNLPWV